MGCYRIARLEKNESVLEVVHSKVGASNFFEGDWYNYGARFYDPVIGRWTGVDPLAILAPEWTPYRYGFNNPILFTDPRGMYEKKGQARRAKRRAKRMGHKDAEVIGEKGDWGVVYSSKDGTENITTTGSFEQGSIGNMLKGILRKGDDYVTSGVILNDTEDFAKKVVEKKVDAALNVSTSIGGHLYDRALIILREGPHEGGAFDEKNDPKTPRVRFSFEDKLKFYTEANDETGYHIKEIAKAQSTIITSLPGGGIPGMGVKLYTNAVIEKLVDNDSKK